MRLLFSQTLIAIAWAGLVACQGQGNAPSSTPTPMASAPVAQAPQLVTEEAGGDTVNAWCRLSGETGARLTCPLDLDTTGSSEPASGLQFQVRWSPADLRFLGIESTVCASGGAPCAPLMSPPAKAIGSLGHSLATNPPDVTTADGVATLMMYHGSNPNVALAGALGALVFEARRPVAGSQIQLDALTATSPAAQPLTLRAVGQTLQLAP